MYRDLKETPEETPQTVKKTTTAAAAAATAATAATAAATRAARYHLGLGCMHSLTAMYKQQLKDIILFIYLQIKLRRKR